ncbi:hypothetical protein OHA02_51830 [Streptomyces phaeochromogenes]|nr:hypothetical protein [Streptomyces phaeochromogenes]
MQLLARARSDWKLKQLRMPVWGDPPGFSRKDCAFDGQAFGFTSHPKVTAETTAFVESVAKQGKFERYRRFFRHQAKGQ